MKLSKQFWPQYLFLLLCYYAEQNAAAISSFPKRHHYLETDFLIHKVSLTQKGYIQFLRYISDVPELHDYTFCIWVNSQNFTHNHPLISYSKHEEERLIRVWIAPQGTHIHLEIMNVPVFKVPVNLLENHWYHVCQSWSANQAAWNLYLNGKLKAGGFVPKLKGIPIKEGGDIVVGQEYTDFDKGLDDGIEGDIFGFNFVLSSTSPSLKHPINAIKPANYLLRRHYDPFNQPPINPIPLNQHADEIPSVLSYFNVQPNRAPKGLFDVGRTIFNNFFDFFEPQKPQARIVMHAQPFRVPLDANRVPLVANRILNDIQEYTPKTLGLKLVEMSFDCALNKGAPLSGKGVLISWTKTPVRVFGGAILKSIPPFCT